MTQMEKLENMLNISNIPFEITEHWSHTEQIWYPSRENPICDVVCFSDAGLDRSYGLGGSYGHEEGLLEIMDLVDGEKTVEGWLTAEKVFDRIWDDYITKYYEVEDDEE